MTDDSINMHSSFDSSLSPKVSRISRVEASALRSESTQIDNKIPSSHSESFSLEKEEVIARAKIVSIGCDELNSAF